MTTRRRRWTQAGVLTTLIALGVAAGLFLPNRNYVSATEPRRDWPSWWRTIRNPPLTSDALKVTIAANDIEVITTGSNLHIRYIPPTSPLDKHWRDRVDSLIVGEQVGEVDIGAEEPVVVTHVAIRYQTDTVTYWTGVFTLPDWSAVEPTAIPDDLRVHTSRQKPPRNAIQYLVRIRTPPSVLRVIRPLLADINLKSSLGLMPVASIAPQDGVVFATLESRTRHASEAELFADILHAPIGPMIFDPRRGEALTSMPGLDAQAKLVLAESCGYFAPLSMGRERPPHRDQMLSHTRFDLMSLAILTEPYLPQDRFFYSIQLRNEEAIATRPSGERDVSPWENPFLVQVAKTRLDQAEKVQVTYGSRLDRVRIRLGKLPIPGGDVDNLCDLRIPYLDLQNRNEAVDVLSAILRVRISSVPHYRVPEPRGISFPDTERIYRDVSVPQLMQIAQLDGERVVIDGEAQQIRIEQLLPWPRRAWRWLQAWLP